jgi:hypothetical protein
MVWDDVKREAARQRMNKARAVRMANLAKKNGHVGSAVSEPPLHTDAVSGVEVAPDLVLTVRRIHVGSFSGLWELARVEPDGSIKVITDANTKAIVISLARNEILKCGQ